MNQEVPQRNTDRESRNGMNSTLFVLITSLCASTSTHLTTPHTQSMKIDRLARVRRSLRLFVTLTMMESGEAYMQMEKMVAARPQKILRALPWRASSEMSTTAAKMEMTTPSRPSIRSRIRRSAKMRKITT